MATIQIPYYKSYQSLHIEEDNLKAVLSVDIDESNYKVTGEPLIREALLNPVGTKSLYELAKGKDKVVLVTSDHTRSMPSKTTLPILLSEIRRANPKADITLLIATGLHRSPTEAEMRSMFGDDIVDNEKIAVNDAFKPEDFEFVCELPSGAGFYVNRIALECDLLIAEGFIEPHFFAGFSGGRKSILPGICSQETVNENHSFKAIASPGSRSGMLEENPIHKDMIYAARKVGLGFIFNVVLDENKRIIAAFAGDMEAAHDKGVQFIRNIAQRTVVTGDIVVTGNSGYPLDQNLYQAAKAADTAESCAGQDGVIILCSSCCDGMGGEYFEKLIVSGTPEEITAKLSKIPPKETIPEQWCAQIFARILTKHKVILVSEFPDHDVVKKANFIPARDVNEALEIAYEIKGRAAQVVVIPDGVSVLAVNDR